MMSGQETIASRIIKLNQLIIGKNTSNLPNKFLAHRDGLLDVLFALYEECNVDYMRKNKHIASFVDKFKGLMVELKSLRVNLRDFEVKKIIGRGHFGEVQVVREKATGDVYAMKVLRKEETLLQQNVAFYKEERDIMSLTTSPWLTQLQYAFQDSQNLYLIMEFHPGGDMLSLLEKYDKVLPADMCQFYLAELVLAIHSLHSMGYVHRDIKPDNILIDRTGHIKLADFGSASKLNSNKQVMSCMPVGTPDYVAPEVLAAMNPGPVSSKSYGIECDWWSLGIVTYEMIFGSTPFFNEKVLITYNNIMNFKNSLKFPADCSDISEELIQLIRGLLNEASERLGYDQLIVHPLFTDIDWNNIRHTAPPFMPTVMSVDDTSNFDDFEPENRPYIGDLKGKKEFTGRNLPFVGFTYTTPLETAVWRLSSTDDANLFSPSTSFCDPDKSKKEIASLQSTVSHLTTAEESLRAEISKLQAHQGTKERELEKVKEEKKVMEQLNEELTAEVQQVKQLLSYEREHRVITEQKAAQLVRCMKSKQKQDALRLRAKSLEYNKGETEKCTLEERLDEALAKIEEFVQERADLLEDLEATKHALLDCQSKLKEMDSTYPMLSEGKNKSKPSRSSLSTSKSEMETGDLRRLIYKLEKKNVELERDLEMAALAKTEKEISIAALQNTVLQLESKIKEQILNMQREISDSECLNTESKSSRSDLVPSDTKGSSALVATSDFSEDSTPETSDISEISAQDDRSLQSSECHTVETDGLSSVLSSSEVNRVNLTITSIKNIDIPSESEFRVSQVSVPSDIPKSPAQDITREKRRSSGPQHLKEENESLKSRVEDLCAENARLKEEMKVALSDLKKQCNEKEAALSEMKLDLRISARKEQQAESLTSSLRERNKELREKIKSLEEVMDIKLKTETALRQQIKSMEAELFEKKQEVTEKGKLLEIEKAKNEERVKAMQYTCEVSKDVSRKFAKSQDHYEEVVKKNMDLLKEREEACKRNTELLEEMKALKKELSEKENECSKLEKIVNKLKSCCTDMEEDFKDFEIIIEAREAAIKELQENEKELQLESKKLEEALRLSREDCKKAERKSEELVKHIEELTTEMDSSNFLHETEMQNVHEQLAYYKKMATDMEEQYTSLQREWSSQNSDCKSYSEKILNLESQLCEIKEEAARHITQISSLKSSNLKLTQSLEEAIEHYKEAEQSMEDLSLDIESIKANHLQEKVKLQETIAQQTKLIDFLQSKTETFEKKKKPHLARLFGRKENTSNMPMQYRDLEKLLETERSRCRRLQDQLSQSRAENVALHKEMSSVKNVEVPASPKSRAMHCVITQSPGYSEAESPVLVSKELVKKFSKPPGMKHNIPHRFVNILCMRSTKCCACLDSLHFGRSLSKCQECSAVCHPTCADSLPSTCGLPSAYMQHFKTVINSGTSRSVESVGDRLTEGWVKVPNNKKLGWDRRYLRIIDSTQLCFFESAEECDPDRSAIQLDFDPKVGHMVVTSAVSATELPFAAATDLPYVMKLEYYPRTTCWPQRCLYIMTSNFSDKQMWVSTLEALAEENETEFDKCEKKKLLCKAVWTMKGEKVIDPLCTKILDDNIILLGAVEGLYVLQRVNSLTCSLRCKIEGLHCVYQIACLKSTASVLFIQGTEKRLTLAQLGSVQSAVQEKLGSLTTQPVGDISDCHLFAVEEEHHPGAPFLCVATSQYVMLYQWDALLKTFCRRKVFETKEPCSCIHFTSRSSIFGSDSFYEVDLSRFTFKKFFDKRDVSLAGVIYGASHYGSFPIALFQVSDEPVEYLICFHEMGVFVNGSGQRTRAEDMKWSRLPLSFAYQLPYLFVTHFNSIEVIEIPPQDTTENGQRGVTLIKNPQYLGPAHLEQSIFLSSCHDQVIELMVVDGSSIGTSHFTTDHLSSCSPGSSERGSEGLDFSFSTSIDQSLADFSVDQLPM